MCKTIQNRSKIQAALQPSVLALVRTSDGASIDAALDQMVATALAADPEADPSTFRGDVTGLLDALVDQGQITDLQARIAWARLAAFLSVKRPMPSGPSGGRVRERSFVSNRRGIWHPAPVSKANKMKRDCALRLLAVQFGHEQPFAELANAAAQYPTSRPPSVAWVLPQSQLRFQLATASKVETQLRALLRFLTSDLGAITSEQLGA